jgi:hypothetical protein
LKILSLRNLFSLALSLFILNLSSYFEFQASKLCQDFWFSRRYNPMCVISISFLSMSSLQIYSSLLQNQYSSSKSSVSVLSKSDYPVLETRLSGFGHQTCTASSLDSSKLYQTSLVIPLDLSGLLSKFSI